MPTEIKNTEAFKKFCENSPAAKLWSKEEQKFRTLKELKTGETEKSLQAAFMTDFLRDFAYSETHNPLENLGLKLESSTTTSTWGLRNTQKESVSLTPDTAGYKTLMDSGFFTSKEEFHALTLYGQELTSEALVPLVPLSDSTKLANRNKPFMSSYTAQHSIERGKSGELLLSVFLDNMSYLPNLSAQEKKNITIGKYAVVFSLSDSSKIQLKEITLACSPLEKSFQSGNPSEKIRNTVSDFEEGKSILTSANTALTTYLHDSTITGAQKSEITQMQDSILAFLELYPNADLHIEDKRKQDFYALSRVLHKIGNRHTKALKGNTTGYQKTHHAIQKLSHYAKKTPLRSTKRREATAQFSKKLIAIYKPKNTQGVFDTRKSVLNGVLHYARIANLPKKTGDTLLQSAEIYQRVAVYLEKAHGIKNTPSVQAFMDLQKTAGGSTKEQPDFLQDLRKEVKSFSKKYCFLTRSTKAKQALSILEHLTTFKQTKGANFEETRAEIKSILKEDKKIFFQNKQHSRFRQGFFSEHTNPSENVILPAYVRSLDNLLYPKTSRKKTTDATSSVGTAQSQSDETSLQSASSMATPR